MLGSPLGFIAVWTELLQVVAVEAAQELRLPVLLIVDFPLELYIALVRQTLLNLRAFYLYILGA